LFSSGGFGVAFRPARPGAAGCPSGSADGATGMGPVGRRFPGAVAAALALTAFPRGLLRFRRTFEAFPHRTILCALGWVFGSTPSRDGPHELLYLLWPRPSGLGHAVLSRFAVSRGRSLTGCSGVPPRMPPHFPATGRARARPPFAGHSPRTGGELRVRSHSRAMRASLPGRSIGLPRCRVDQLVGRSAHRCAAPDRWIGISLVPAGNPCCCRASSSRPFAGCLSRRLRRAFPVGPGRLPSLRQTGATRSARSVPVVRFPPRRFAPRAGSQAFAPGTGSGSAVVSTPRSRRPPLVSQLRSVRASRRFPAALPHTPRRTRLPCTCAPGTRTLDPPHRVTAAVASMPFSRLRGFSRALQASVSRTVVADRPDTRCPSIGLCSPSRPSSRPPPHFRRRLCSRCRWRGSSRRLRGVCPVEALPPVAG